MLTNVNAMSCAAVGILVLPCLLGDTPIQNFRWFISEGRQEWYRMAFGAGLMEINCGLEVEG